MVGNGCTNWDVDCTPAYMEMAYWHGLYDDDLYKTIISNNCEAQFTGFFDGTKRTSVCYKAYSRFATLTADINVYDVFGHCYQPTDTMKASEEF